MISAGIDVGARFTKVVLVDDSKIIGYGKIITGFDIKKCVEEAVDKALDMANIKFRDVDRVVATGMGREICKSPPFNATKVISEIVSAAIGAVKLYPSTRTVIDVGAEDCRVSKVDEGGRVLDFATNDKCAAGTGTFLEVIARVLETDLHNLGELSLRSRNQLPINAQCTVFAESEVVSLIHHFKASKEDIAGSIIDSLTSRIVGIVRRVGVNRDVLVGGGPALLPGFKEYLYKNLGVELIIPEKPEYICAYGAAII